MVQKYICEIWLILAILCDFERFVNARYLVVNGWTPADHRTPVDIMVDVTNNIGLLVLECHNSNNHNNIAFSPYGLTSVLIALNEGVSGESNLQIHRTARFPFDKDIMRVGFRDIHRLLRSYFVPQEGFLAGLSLSNDNLTLTPEYKSVLQFYGYDLQPKNSSTPPETSPVPTETTPETPAETTPEKPTETSPEKPAETTPETVAETTPDTTAAPAATTEPQTEMIETTPQMEVSSPEAMISEKIETQSDAAMTMISNMATETEAPQVPAETTTTMATEPPIEITTVTMSPEMLTTEKTTETMAPEMPPEIMTTDKPAETVAPEMTSMPEIVVPETTTTETAVETMVPEMPDMTEVPTEIMTPEMPVMTEASTETMAPEMPVITEVPTETMAPEMPVMTEVPTETMAPEMPMMTEVPTETMAPEMPPEVMTTETPTETMAPDMPSEVMTSETPAVTMATETPPEVMTTEKSAETMAPEMAPATEISTETMAIETPPEVMTTETPAEIMTTEVPSTEAPTETVASEMPPEIVGTETMAPEISTETTTPEMIAEMVTSNNAETPESSAETVPGSPEIIDVDLTDTPGSASVEQTKDPTSLNLSENPRLRRSLADYIIARYHDGRNYFTFQEPVVTSVPPSAAPPQYPFLVNGVKEQYRVKYTEYDAVLPFTYIPRVRALALKFPLDSDKYYLLIVLPVNPQGVNNLICDIRKYDNLRNIVASLKDTYVRAIIPSFMLKGFVFLTNTLQRLGIRNVFEPGHADFSMMTEDPNIYVTNIEQAVTVTIRNYMEASTTLSNNNRKRLYYNYRPVEFKVTHPFMYFIMDSTLDVALMAGKVVNPLNSRIQ